MPRFQNGSSMVDQMTRLKLKLVEKRLLNEKHNMDDRAESAQSARSYDGHLDQLHCALRRKQDLLKRLREQHILEDLNRPHTWGGSHKKYMSHFFTSPQPPPPLLLHQPAPALSFLTPPPPALTQPQRIIQQTLPQQPATIIQQLPQQQPLITQITPPQPYPAPRSGSIKEDMVELMLMQNAQMHQIIMHNMMLKATTPTSPPEVPRFCVPQTTYLGQDTYYGNPILVRPDVKPRGNAVHHHHYGTTPAAPHLPPISHPAWPPEVRSVQSEKAGGHLPSIHHVTASLTLPPLDG
ncbi:uncharacterized protein C21orf58 [Anoplopoma fimbria]|uniref:uncharacterized protein C21orf58 n=1 Tax=Anoplopoma fimbria TaxID=229290 RepID=UPI0023ED4A1C|nr:uncharacterized protein C21orf58 [Anoplopoma fimbria]